MILLFSARPAPIACANQQIPSRNPVFIDIRAKEASIIVSRKLYKKETEVIFISVFAFLRLKRKAGKKLRLLLREMKMSALEQNLREILTETQI